MKSAPGDLRADDKLLTYANYKERVKPDKNNCTACVWPQPYIVNESVFVIDP